MQKADCTSQALRWNHPHEEVAEGRPSWSPPSHRSPRRAAQRGAKGHKGSRGGADRSYPELDRSWCMIVSALRSSSALLYELFELWRLGGLFACYGWECTI